MHPSSPGQIVSCVFALTLLVGLLTSCVTIPTPGVYKLDIQQGNVVTQDMLARLEPNMEKRKVRFLLGTPLITDTFHEDRWDYIYSFQEGGGARTQQHIVLIFDEEILVHIEGDADSTAIGLPQPPNPETVVSVPDQEPPGIFGGIGGWFGTDETRVPRKKPPPGDDADENGGVFANIFDGPEEPAEDAAPESNANAAEDADSLQDSDLEQIPISEDDALDVNEQNASVEEDPDDDESGFFTRLKKNFEGDADEETEDEVTNAGVNESSSGQDVEEEGFFERLSGQFGLDAPIEAPNDKN